MSQYHETLITPGGSEYISRSPGETNDLVYGYGYRRKTTETAATSSPQADRPSPPATTSQRASIESDAESSDDTTDENDQDSDETE